MKLGGKFLTWLLFSASTLLAQKNETGTVAGSVFDPAANRPAAVVTVALRKTGGGTPLATAVTDKQGLFALENVPFGEYQVVYGYLGLESQESAMFSVTAQHRATDLGRLVITNTAIKMEQFAVSARRQAFENSIDRKVYNVGKDIQSATGSASDLLQNVPSVQVDIEGNVSLRGDDNVLILVDGKPSTLMNAANRATSLEQMPSDSIERIEVITNPSAKYKPDGTAGIINIVLKRQHEPGYSATIRANVGNDSRYSLGLTGNYHPGKYNFYGALNVRQDDRPRYTQENRTHPDPVTNLPLSTAQYTVERSRPLSRLVQAGVDDQVDADTKLGATVDYNYRTFFRTSTINNLSRNADGTVASDYDRDRTDPEWQKTVEFATTYQHGFAKEGQELSLELKHDRHWEQEDNHYADVYRTPVTPTSFDYTLIKPTETGTELTADYSQPFAKEAKLDAGYSLEGAKDDEDFHGGFLDPASGLWVVDPTTTNRFIYRDRIQALYATFGRPIGNFAYLAGLRAEFAEIDTDQVTTAVREQNNYLRLYPSLHLSYNLTDASQLQLNYSHRIHRPESDDLNPFPAYQDPYNLHAGNPQLLPEETHSVEAGYQYKKDDNSYLATLYYRQTYHAFTTVTRYIDSTTLLTTQENLATNRSGGLELVASGDLSHQITANFSSNIFYSEIDASNLGYSTNKSTIAWSAKLNASWHTSKSDMIQFNTNYTAKRLTPQGDRLPTFVANIGLKHDFKNKKTAFVLTVSDVFNSLKEETIINTPGLYDDIIRRRSSRIIYAGFVYSFGKASKKAKDDALQFDNQP